MIQIVTKKDKDPTEEFTGIWVNKKSGSIWLWADMPVLLGFIGDGKMVRADVFEAEFKYVQQRNKQKYSYDFDYHGLPMMVIADVSSTDFVGNDISIYFGDEYGTVANNGKYIVAQNGNVLIGEKLKISCVPASGTKNVVLTVLTYE